jgi:hypothetical protein
MSYMPASFARGCSMSNAIILPIRGAVLACSLLTLTGCVSLLSPYEEMADKKLAGVAEALLDIQARAQLTPAPLENTPDLQAKGVELRTAIRVARNMYSESYGVRMRDAHRTLVVDTIDRCDNAVNAFFVTVADLDRISDPATNLLLTTAHATCLTAAERVQDGKS